jgi:hypothetical protein
MFTFLICNNAARLHEAHPLVTIEAEYGEECVEGTWLTLAHHGSRSSNPPPCLWEGDEKNLGEMTREALRQYRTISVGLSHLDLDALGGILTLIARREAKDNVLFWQAAAYVDLHGAHMLPNFLKHSAAEEVVRDQLWAFWAWSEEHPLYPPRDGSVMDCTKEVLNAVNVLQRILKEEPELIALGRAARRAEKELDNQSFQANVGQVVVRQHEKFCNHLYRHDQAVAKAVVGYNPKQGSITVSLAEPVIGVSCRTLVQTLWGPEAGGHDGIAGSPRGKEMTFEQALGAAQVLDKKLHDVSM